MVGIFFVGAPALGLAIEFFHWLGWSAPVAGGVAFLAGAFVVWAWHGFPVPSLEDDYEELPPPRPLLPPRPGLEPWPPPPGPGGPRSQAWWSDRS
jgi:hypothetical protein